MEENPSHLFTFHHGLYCSEVKVIKITDLSDLYYDLDEIANDSGDCSLSWFHILDNDLAQL